MYIIISFGAVELFKSFMEGAKDLKLRYTLARHRLLQGQTIGTIG